MSSKYKITNQDSAYFITITIIDWVDIFTKPIYKHIIIDSFKFCQKNKGLVVHSFVIMPSHIHMIVSRKSNNKIDDIIRDFKKHTSKELQRAIKESPESRKKWLLNKFSYAANRIKNGVHYKIWKDGYHAIELLSTTMIEQKLDYIHDNPVKAEIVTKPEHYKYSSAINYSDKMGVMNIEKI